MIGQSFIRAVKRDAGSMNNGAISRTERPRGFDKQLSLSLSISQQLVVFAMLCQTTYL